MALIIIRLLTTNRMFSCITIVLDTPALVVSPLVRQELVDVLVGFIDQSRDPRRSVVADNIFSNNYKITIFSFDIFSLSGLIGLRNHFRSEAVYS
jgi:hypothetical protein